MIQTKYSDWKQNNLAVCVWVCVRICACICVLDDLGGIINGVIVCDGVWTAHQQQQQRQQAPPPARRKRRKRRCSCGTGRAERPSASSNRCVDTRVQSKRTCVRRSPACTARPDGLFLLFPHAAAEFEPNIPQLELLARSARSQKNTTEPDRQQDERTAPDEPLYPPNPQIGLRTVILWSLCCFSSSGCCRSSR